jgi:phage tail sheath protein FI
MAKTITDIKTPGVYIYEVSNLPPSVAQVSTAIPVFIGYTEKAKDAAGAPLNKVPTKIFSLLEYVQYFGRAFSEKKVTVQVTRIKTGDVVTSEEVKAKVENISKYKMYYSLRHYFDNGGGPCYIVSVGEFTEEGTIADADLEEGLSIIEAYDEPTIIVFPEGSAMGEEKYYPLIKNINNFRNTDHTTGFKKNDDLNYAAAYYPNLITTYGYQYEDKDVGVSISTGTGTPDEKKLNELKDTDKATYYKAIDAIGKYTITLPPSPAIAGIYAKVDGERGVWKAPANVSLSSVSDLAEVVTDEEQESMNIDAGTGKSINAIRSFSGKGILVWGARTLDGNSNEWRYISVRRFFIMV